jgi:transposase
MLVELSKVEQRYDAVLSVMRDGLTISEAALTYGVSRQSIYRWMQRYEQGGLAALAQRSHRPQSCPHQMDARIEDRIITLRWRTPKMELPGENVVRDPPGALARGWSRGHHD